jgi:hypothetical protein
MIEFRHLPVGHFGVGNVIHYPSDLPTGPKLRFLMTGVNPSHLDSFHIKAEVC